MRLALFLVVAVLLSVIVIDRWEWSVMTSKIPKRPYKILTVSNGAEFDYAARMADFEDHINLNPGEYWDKTQPVDGSRLFEWARHYTPSSWF
jgi:hypothetical protein